MKKIEKYIFPLVQHLIEIPGIRTYASCEGHYGKHDAWVIFSCHDIMLPYIFCRFFGVTVKFKRVKGYREIPKLIAALQQKNTDRKEVAA